MKLILSTILYYIGDIISKLFLRFDITAYYMYPIYNKIMTLSNYIIYDKEKN
jgi:hypothetical protein